MYISIWGDNDLNTKIELLLCLDAFKNSVLVQQLDF